MLFVLVSALQASAVPESELAEECRRQLDCAERYYDQGEVSRAEQSFRSALAIAEQLPANDFVRGKALGGLGAVLLEQGRFPQAEQTLAAAVQALRRCSAERGRLELANVIHNQAILYKQQNRLFVAEQLLNQAAALYSRIPAAAPQSANVFATFGWLELERHRPAAAETHFRQALDKISHIDGLNRTRGFVYDGLSRALIELHRPKEAVEAAKRALAAGSLDSHVSRLELVSHSCILARASSEVGDYALAERTLIRAQDILGNLAETKPNELGVLLIEYATLRYFQGRYSEAVEFQRKGLDILRNHLSPDRPQIVTGMANYAHMLRKLKRKDEAKEVEQEVRQAQRRTVGDPGREYTISVAGLRRKR